MKKSLILICVLGLVLLNFTACKDKNGVDTSGGGQQAPIETINPEAPTGDPSITQDPPSTAAPNGTGTVNPNNNQSNTSGTKTSYKITYDAAMEIAVKAAVKKFGANPFVIPVGGETPENVDIDGKSRPCYYFGADSADIPEGTLRGLFHIDANTGEVFNYENEQMVKIEY